jgi:hypothetical protein
MAETYSVITSHETKLFALRALAYQLFIAGKIVLLDGLNMYDGGL